jgi:ABC-2 type transport system permease protein
MRSGRRTRGDLGSVFDRTMREQRRATLGWTAGVVAFCLLMLSMYPTIRGNHAFSKLIDAYPEPLKKLFSLSNYTTSVGYLRTEVFSFMAPLLISIFAVILGSDLLAGEEERRTIDILLANPISRRRVVVEKWLALATGTLALSLTLEMVLGLVGPLFKLHLGWRTLSAEILGTALFALFAGTLAMAIGAATGGRGIARGSAAAITVAMYLLSTLAQLVTSLKPVEWVSLWFQTLGGDPLGTGFHYWHLSAVALVILALLGATVLLFDRRDLAT